MRILVDATTLIALGGVGELHLLDAFDGDISVPPAVRSEVTTEPARTNLDRFLDDGDDLPIDGSYVDQARRILDETAVTGDVQLIAVVLEHVETNRDVAVVSDDRRVRTTALGLGARVTGTIGVVVRGVEEGRPAEEGKDLVRRIDGDGLHLTGELRETAYDLIEDAARED